GGLGGGGEGERERQRDGGVAGPGGAFEQVQPVAGPAAAQDVVESSHSGGSPRQGFSSLVHRQDRQSSSKMMESGRSRAVSAAWRSGPPSRASRSDRPTQKCRSGSHRRCGSGQLGVRRGGAGGEGGRPDRSVVCESRRRAGAPDHSTAMQSTSMSKGPGQDGT